MGTSLYSNLMPIDPSVSFELQLLFLRELGEGLARARLAFSALRSDGLDVAALDELGNFFHRIAGTAAQVGEGVLGRLAAACEGAVAALGVPASSALLQIIEDGLEGMEMVLAVARPPDLEQPAAPEKPAIPQQPSSQPPPPLSELSPAPRGEGSPWRILVVDDDPFSARLVDSVLRAAGFHSSYCCEPAEAFEVICAELPDLIILDVVMPGMDGFDLCRQIRQYPALQLTPIIFVTRKGDVEQRVRGLSVGGNDYVAKPFEPQELVARVRSHLSRLAELRELAVRDGLTRCYNNKYFKSRLEQEITRARRYTSELTLGMVDIDHFKRVNDTFGHQAGDTVLAHLASLLTASVRSSDMVARFGGEEFAFLLIEAQLAEAAIITNRMRERIAHHEFILPALSGGDLTVTATVSVGLAQLKPEDTAKTFINRADGALYKAKELGRNQVRIAT